jgi:hypothetical protein
MTAPGSAVLTANATDNVGVTSVEFYRGSTLIATDATPGDGFTQSVAFTSVDVSNQSFTARAVDGAGNAVTSAAAVARVGVEAITNSALTLNDTMVQNVNGTAIELASAGGATVTLNGGEIKNVQGAALRLTSGSFNTRLRSVVISNTGISQGDGAIALFGDAASVYDLGTAAQPGGNTILGNNASRPGLRVGAASGVTVNAVGNTWVGGQQGASAGGTYSGNVLVTGGSGTNHTVTSGALRLSQ